MPADPLLTLEHSSPIVTLQSHLLSEQARIPGSTGTLCWADPRSQTICVVLTTLPGGAVKPQGHWAGLGACQCRAKGRGSGTSSLQHGGRAATPLESCQPASHH